MTTARYVLLIASILLLSGCAGTRSVGSVGGGECQIVRTPEYAVKGRTAYDARWINTTTEALVDGCGQPRPKARPPAFDAPKAKPKAVKKAPPKQEKKWWDYRARLES